MHDSQCPAVLRAEGCREPPNMFSEPLGNRLRGAEWRNTGEGWRPAGFCPETLRTHHCSLHGAMCEGPRGSQTPALPPRRPCLARDRHLSVIVGSLHQKLNWGKVRGKSGGVGQAPRRRNSMTCILENRTRRQRGEGKAF